MFEKICFQTYSKLSIATAYSAPYGKDTNCQQCSVYLSQMSMVITQSIRNYFVWESSFATCTYWLQLLQLGKSDIHVERKILFNNEMKQYKIWQRLKGRVQKIFQTLPTNFDATCRKSYRGQFLDRWTVSKMNRWIDSQIKRQTGSQMNRWTGI